jgi:eukaryotic-like serine/threonine-protein kinase
MQYPQAEDYIRAVQQPEQAFLRPELRAAAFDVHPVFRIPMPASGNAAVVFRAEVEGADTALRFFIREDASTRERYTALGQHFAGHGIEDCVAHPTWLDDAISLNDVTWPMVRMEWVDGRTLEEYVGHLARGGDTGALSSLATTWRGFVGRLQQADFAHGDLQHGNILVDTSSTLRLVDFDGSWIASFQGGPPPRETGHPNYQPAGRKWGRWMDTFPGLVIYTALLTLARRPGSWTQLQNGENILFSAGDFVPPFRTPAWETVASVPDAEVTQAAEQLKRVCASGWGADEPLESLLTARPRIEVRADPAPAEAPLFPGVQLPSLPVQWWEPAEPMPTSANAASPPPAATTHPANAASPPPATTHPANAASPPPLATTHPANAAMPPPPPKTQPGTQAPSSPSFSASPPGTWYGGVSGRMSGPGSPGGSVGPAAPGRPVRTGRRPAGELVRLLLLIVALTALVSGLVVGAAGGDGALAAGVSALVAALLALPLLRRRRQ